MNNGIIALAVIIIIGGGAYWFMNQAKSPVVTVTPNTDTSSAMRAEENMIVVSEQKPGSTVLVSQVHLAKSGFVVIHEDTNNAPGAIIGASALLQAGDSSQISITLARAITDSTKLHAMLHNDTNGDGTFSASSDMPVQSTLGGPIEGWFDVSASASANVPISI